MSRLFAEPVFAGLLVVMGVALLGWPFVEVARAAGEGPLFVYFFAVWAGIVALAAALARAVGDAEEGPHV